VSCFQTPKKEVKEKEARPSGWKKEYGRFHLSRLRYAEEISLTVVQDFDAMDLGDEAVAPRFSCEECRGEMYPEYYKGVHGIEYKISDVRPT
jgi:hypothetical protein